MNSNNGLNFNSIYKPKYTTQQSQQSQQPQHNHHRPQHLNQITTQPRRQTKSQKQFNSIVKQWSEYSKATKIGTHFLNVVDNTYNSHQSSYNTYLSSRKRNDDSSSDDDLYYDTSLSKVDEIEYFDPSSDEDKTISFDQLLSSTSNNSKVQKNKVHYESSLKSTKKQMQMGDNDDNIDYNNNDDEIDYNDDTDDVEPNFLNQQQHQPKNKHSQSKPQPQPLFKSIQQSTMPKQSAQKSLEASHYYPHPLPFLQHQNSIVTTNNTHNVKQTKSIPSSTLSTTSSHTDTSSTIPFHLEPNTLYSNILQSLIEISLNLNLWGDLNTQLIHLNQIQIHLQNQSTHTDGSNTLHHYEQPAILTHIHLLFKSMTQIITELPFSMLQQLITFQQRQFPYLQQTNWGQLEPFYSFRIRPQVLNPYHLLPSRTILNASFYSTLLQHISTLFTSSTNLLESTSIQSIQPIQSIMNQFIEFSTTTLSSSPTISNSTTFTESFLQSLLTTSPQSIFQSIHHLQQHNTTTMNQLRHNVQILHCLTTLFNFSGVTIPINTNYLILLQLLPLISSPKPSSNATTMASTTHNSTTRSNIGTNPFYSPIPIEVVEELFLNTISSLLETIQPSNQDTNTNSQSPKQPTTMGDVDDNDQQSNQSTQLQSHIQFSFHDQIQIQLLFHTIIHSPQYQSIGLNIKKAILQAKKLYKPITQFSRTTSTHLSSQSLSTISKSEQSSPQLNIIHQHSQTITPTKYTNEFFSLVLSPIFTSTDFTHYPPFYDFQSILQLFSTYFQDKQIESTMPSETTTQSIPTTIPSILDFSNFSFNLNPIPTFPQHHLNEIHNIHIATTSPHDYTSFTPTLSQSIVSTVEQQSLIQQALHIPLIQTPDQYFQQQLNLQSNTDSTYQHNNNNKYSSIEAIIANTDINTPLPSYSAQKALISTNNNLNSSTPLSTIPSPSFIHSIQPNQLNDLLFPSTIFQPFEEHLAQQSLMNQNPTSQPTTTNNINKNDNNSTYFPHNLLAQTTLSFPLLSEFIAASLSTITTNLYSIFINLLPSIHFQQSISHLFYTYLHQSLIQQHRTISLIPNSTLLQHLPQPSSLPNFTSSSPNTSTISKLSIDDWYDQYHNQYQLFTQKDQLFFYLSTIPIDLRFQQSSSLSSRRFMYQYIFNQLQQQQQLLNTKTNSKDNTRSINTTTIPSTQLSAFIQYYQLYHNLSRISLPPTPLSTTLESTTITSQSQINTTSLAFTTTDLNHFYQNIPYYAIITLISLLQSQYTEIYESSQNQLLSKFFAAVELNSLNLHSYSLTKKQKSIMSQLVHSPTIQINFLNSLQYQLPTTIPLTTHHDCFSFRFTFPKSFPSFTTRIATYNRILSTLQSFAQDYIYPTLFDQHNPFQQQQLQSNSITSDSNFNNSLETNSTRSSTTTSTSTSTSNDISSLGCLTSLSKYIYKLNDVLYVKTSAIPWMFDAFFTPIDQASTTTSTTQQLNDITSNSISSNVRSSRHRKVGDSSDSDQDDSNIQQQSQPNSTTSSKIKSNDNQHNDQDNNSRSNALTHVLDDILHRLENDTNQNVNVTLIPVSQVYPIKSQSNQFIQFDQTSQFDPLGFKLISKDNHNITTSSTSTTISKPIEFHSSISPILSNYYPGLKFLMETQQYQQSTNESIQLTHSTTSLSSSIPSLSSSTTSSTSFNTNTINKLATNDYIIPYKSYIVYLASLLETCCLIASMSSVFTTSALTLPPTSPSTTAPTNQQLNQQHLNSNNNININKVNNIDYSTDSNKIHDYNIYSMPYLFPTVQSNHYESFLTLLLNSNLSTSGLQSISTQQSNQQQLHQPIQSHPLFQQNQTLNSNQHFTSLLSSQPPQSSSITNEFNVSLSDHSHSSYRSIVSSLLQQNWTLLLLLTLFNPIHILSLNSLYFDGGITARNFLSIENAERENRKIEIDIGTHLEPKTAPYCTECGSNLYIYLYTIANMISSTKVEIYGTSDDTLIEKFTCRNPIGCVNSWVVKS